MKAVKLKVMCIIVCGATFKIFEGFSQLAIYVGISRRAAKDFLTEKRIL
jgi:hypothetical protein